MSKAYMKGQKENGEEAKILDVITEKLDEITPYE